MAAGHRHSMPQTTRAATSSKRKFNTTKRWRGLATRYDKLAIVYRGGAVLRAITLWTAHLSDTP